jgi:hypothetical protein
MIRLDRLDSTHVSNTGWCDLHQRFGKLDFASVLAPAIRYAREGFPVSEVSLLVSPLYPGLS